MDEHKGVGERIAHYRRRLGITQEVLAGLAGCSDSWVSKLERGDRTVEKIGDLFALARVLKVEPGDLLDGIEPPPNGGAPLEEPRGIHAVSRAVMTPRLPDLEPVAAVQLRAAVEQALRERFVHGRPETGVLTLPEVIMDSRVAVAAEVPGAWWCLAGAYRVTSSLAGIFGDTKLAWIAAHQAVAAAERSGDELMVASAQRRLAFALLHLGWLDDAGSVCSDAADAIAPSDVTSPAGWSLWGSLHLTGAVAAARADDGVYARRLLRDARAAAERIGLGHDDYYWESFGLANVGAHEVAVELESGDPVEALRLADRVQIEQMPGEERPATFLIEVGHTYALRRGDGAAVAALLEAERYAPEMVRYSVLAHEIVRVLLGRERRSRTPGLRGLAERLRVTD